MVYGLMDFYGLLLSEFWKISILDKKRFSAPLINAGVGWQLRNKKSNPMEVLSVSY